MMAEKTEWKRPSDVMKIHRRRKSVSQKRIPTSENDRTTVIYKSPSKSVKRRNPFSVSDVGQNPAKRQHIEHSTYNPNDKCALFEVLSNSLTKTDTQAQVLDIETNYSHHGEDKVTQPSKLKEQNEKIESTSVDQQHEEIVPYLPFDWSIKTKMRIVSNQSLQWCTQLKSTDEAQGVTRFVCAEQIKIDNLNEQKQSFQSCCMFWEHPNIPWARLFPRIIDDSKLSGSGSFLLQDDIQKTLQADWEQSFTSVFHQLRSRLCPYFYLCTHQFTVMFYNQSEMVAMVTPTTRGFRESLNNEGITFELPVGNENKQSSQDTRRSDSKENDQPIDVTESNEENSTKLDEQETDDILDTDDAAAGWLESIGLDKKAFPSLDPRKVKIQRESFRVIDNRPESLVFVQGSDVQALFNFLLNCRTCTATSGPQAGIPPTILSPKPFKGATLKSHKVKHSMVKQSDSEGHISRAHILEVTGPIFTCHSQALTELLHSTQSADFSIVYNNHDATTPFNILSKVFSEQLKKTNSQESSPCVKTDHTLNEKGDNSSSSPKGGYSSGVKGDYSASEKGYGSSTENGDCSSNEKGYHISVPKGTFCKDKEKGFYRHVKISERLSAIKEIICKPQGFEWRC